MKKIRLTDKMHTFFFDTEWGSFEVMIKSGIATVDHTPPGSTEDSPAKVWKMPSRKGVPGENMARQYVGFYLTQFLGVKPEELE